MNPDEPAKRPRVVVTGIGAVSPVGNNIEEMWAALIAGKSGVGYITSFDTTDFETKIAAEVKNFDASIYANRKLIQRMDRFTQFAVGASLQAVQAARLSINASNATDCGVIIGNSVCGLLSVSEQYKVLTEKGPGRVSPILAPTMTGDAASVQVSLILGAKGVNYAISSACSSGSDAIGAAYNIIRLGDAKVMIAGGTEAPIMPIVIAAFSNIRALSAKNETPQEACRPFDAKRNGFVMAEGSGVIVLEEANHAFERGAPILAELAGYGATSDAFHLIQPAPDGASRRQRGEDCPEEGRHRPRRNRLYQRPRDSHRPQRPHGNQRHQERLRPAGQKDTDIRQQVHDRPSPRGGGEHRGSHHHPGVAAQHHPADH